MNCVVCSKEGAGYNRALVRMDDEETVGGLCSDCESELFGDTFDDPIWCQGDVCAFCDDHGGYALPMHHMELIEVDGDEVIFEDYPIGEQTPRLCVDHAALYFDLDLSFRAKRQDPIEISP